MNKVFEQIWKDYKKANETRRSQLLKKYGFTGEEAFKKYLGVSPKELNKITPKKPAPKKATASKKATAPKKAAKKTAKKTTTDLEDKGLDYVLAFDTTGSMSEYIAAVRQRVVETIHELFEHTPNLRMRIIAFGDYCDPEYSRFQSTIMTDDRNALITFVQNAHNTSGGDSDEFYEYVIKQVVETTDWRKDAQKSFLLIGDCNPHKVGYSYGAVIQNNQIDWKVEARKAKGMGIQIDTLRMPNKAAWYAELAKMTGGVCMDFQTASKTAEIVTGTVYARGSKTAFMAKMDSVMASGDEELIGAYKVMSTLL